MKLVRVDDLFAYSIVIPIFPKKMHAFHELEVGRNRTSSLQKTAELSRDI